MVPNIKYSLLWVTCGAEHESGVSQKRRVGADFLDRLCRCIFSEHLIPPLHGIAGESENKRSVSEVVSGAEHESGTR